MSVGLESPRVEVSEEVANNNDRPVDIGRMAVRTLLALDVLSATVKPYSNEDDYSRIMNRCNNGCSGGGSCSHCSSGGLV